MASYALSGRQPTGWNSSITTFQRGRSSARIRTWDLKVVDSNMDLLPGMLRSLLVGRRTRAVVCRTLR